MNAAVKFDQRMPAAALLNQAIVGYPGDPDVGTQLPGTTINYVDATQIQIAISFYYSESGTVPPSDMQALLVANAGPFVEWNYSYTQFGLPGILTGGASA